MLALASELVNAGFDNLVFWEVEVVRYIPIKYMLADSQLILTLLFLHQLT